MVRAALQRRQTPRSANSGSNKGYIEPRFDYVVLGPRKDVVLCKFDNGALYELPVAALECAEGWDGSAAVAARVVEHGLGAMVKSASGARVEFAPDLVLYHCEPRYAWGEGASRTSRIGGRIRRLRERGGMSLEDLSAKTGIAVPNLSRLEHGKHSPMLATLQKVARALRVAPRALLTD